jgi:hypothetical protein
MRRIRVQRPRRKRGRRWREALAADPRDPDIVRAKALAGREPVPHVSAAASSSLSSRRKA